VARRLQSIRPEVSSMSVSALPRTSLPPTTLFELDALEGLPCGCVTVIYRTRPWNVLVVALEAKGPYCSLPGHTPGQLLRLGDSYDLASEEDDEDGPASASAR
jgi:hypothetical protein